MLNRKTLMRMTVREDVWIAITNLSMPIKNRRSYLYRSIIKDSILLANTTLVVLPNLFLKF